MSRLGKIPLDLPKEVKVNIATDKVLLEGPKGKLEIKIPYGISVELKEQKLIVNRNSDTKQNKSNHGTIRSRLQAMITGVQTGHTRNLEIEGIGFRAQLKGQTIHFNLGFSHPVEFEVPKDIKVAVPTQTNINLESPDVERLGLIAAKIRGLKPVEPYKGKGIRYAGEVVRRKQGKSVTK